MKERCIICENSQISLVKKNYPGYVDGTFFDIYTCNICNTNFVQTESIDENIYDLIYSNTNVLGYDRYLKYAEQVKYVNNPLKYLASFEAPYYSVFKFLSNQERINILEIGCGYGYLTYALNKMGLNATGIDLSSKAIGFAKSNFGENYYNVDLSGFSKINKIKYDLIIATEVIEHQKNPKSFLSECCNLLDTHGKILITTPNKDFMPIDSIWFTDLPPVHTVWLSSMSFRIMAEKLNLNYKEISFHDYYPSSENLLVRFIRSRKEIIQSSLLLPDGKVDNSRHAIQFSKPHILSRKLLHDFSPVRNVFNFIHNSMIRKYYTLSIILGRN